MSELFLEVVNRSICASWLILAVLVIRLLFRRGPKWTHVLLWGIVAVRLLCPVTIESALSLIPSAQTIPEAALTTADFDIRTGITPVDHQVNAFIAERNLQNTAPAASGGGNPVDVLTAVWLCGVAVLAVHTVLSYWRLRRRVDMAVLLRENIYQSEKVTSPFVLGILKPRIYIPFRMEEQHLRYVLAHERAHLQRGPLVDAAGLFAADGPLVQSADVAELHPAVPGHRDGL